MTRSRFPFAHQTHRGNRHQPNQHHPRHQRPRRTPTRSRSPTTRRTLGTASSPWACPSAQALFAEALANARALAQGVTMEDLIQAGA